MAWLAAVLMVIATGCGNGNAATVGAIHISREALGRELDAIGDNKSYVSHLERKAGFAIRDGDGSTPHLVAQVLTNKIKREVTFEMAEERRVTSTREERQRGLLTAQGAVGDPDTLRAFPRWYRDELASYETTVIALVRSLVDQTPEEYYERAEDAFARACGWHIAVGTRDEAVDARRRIEAGESFQSVARSVSRDEKTASKEGNLGCNPRGDLDGRLDELAFTLSIGEISEPVNIGGAFHLLMVSSRETPPLDRVRGEVRAALNGLAASRYESLLKETLIGGGVNVAKDIGVWDAGRLTVLPPAAEQRGSPPTPRPRPLPQVATSSDQVDPNYQVGQRVFITDDGFRPRELVAVVEEEITWINETDAPHSIRFTAGGRKIGPIEPGTSGSYTPEGAITITYSLVEDNDVKGTVFVQPYFAPGEDPGDPDRLDADTPIPGIPTPLSADGS